ncbi:MAG TPA: hypothetical protein VMU25_02115 [Candidatus Paceibacterota bacterium]|nr:hypothetical protein [Candidatus Paceibacterota bacterium]
MLLLKVTLLSLIVGLLHGYVRKSLLVILPIALLGIPVSVLIGITTVETAGIEHLAEISCTTGLAYIVAMFSLETGYFFGKLILEYRNEGT